MLGAYSLSDESRVVYAPISFAFVMTRSWLTLLIGVVASQCCFASVSVFGNHATRGFHWPSKPVTTLRPHADATHDGVEVRNDVLQQTLQRSDTTEFLAGAVDVAPDDDAYDFISQLPGISSFDGALGAFGKPVDRVLVDGAIFYWEDVTTTLRSIPADIIDRVQVYSTQSERSAFTGVRELAVAMTVNIVTTGSRGREIYGALSGAIGPESRYMGSGNATRFDSSLRISVQAATNNTNDQNVAFADGVQALNSEMMYEAGGIPAVTSSGAIDALFGSQEPGIAQTRSFATMMSNVRGPIKVGLSYSMYEHTVDALTAFDRQYVASSFSGEIFRQRDTSQTTSASHRFRLEANVDIDSNSKLLVGTSFRLNSGTSTTERSGLTLFSKETLNSTVSRSTSSVDGTDLFGELGYYRLLGRPRRYASFEMGVWRSSAGVLDALTSLGVSGSRPDLGDTINQRGKRNEAENRFKPQFTFSEPLGDHSDLKLVIAMESSELRMDRLIRSAQFGSQTFTRVDSTLSGYFTQKLSQLGTSAIYTWSDATTSLVSGLEYRQTVLDGESQFPYRLSTTRRFRNILPRFSLLTSWHPEETVQLSYAMMADLPSIDQMQNAVDNSNPLLISRGTPDLKQALRHSIQTSYRRTIPAWDGLTFASARFEYMSDYIGRRTILPKSDTVIDDLFLERGVQYFRPVNLEGAISSSLSGYFGCRIDTLPLRANVNVEASFRRIPGLINGVRNEAMSVAGFIQGHLDCDITSYLSVGAGVGFRGGGVDNSTQTDLDNTFSNFSFNGEFSLTLPHGMTLLMDVRSRNLDVSGEAYDQNILLLNCTLEGHVFANQRGLLRLTIRDALNQGNAVSRLFTDAFTEDRMAMVLRRVILLTFSYRLHETEPATGTSF